jgi:hypothetical protein
LKVISVDSTEYLFFFVFFMTSILKPKTTKGRVSKVTQKIQEKSEKDLEKFLFDQQVEDEGHEELGFFIDVGDQPQEVEAEEAPAWMDDDELEVDIQTKNRLRKLKTDFDETTITSKDYEQRLRSQFEKIHPTPKWATVQEPNAALTTTKKLVQSKQLNPERLLVTRVKDANQDVYTQVILFYVGHHYFLPISSVCTSFTCRGTG